MLQAVEPRPGAWPRVCPEDVRELMPGLDRVAEEMTEAIQRAERLLGPQHEVLGMLPRRDDARG